LFYENDAQIAPNHAAFVAMFANIEAMRMSIVTNIVNIVANIVNIGMILTNFITKLTRFGAMRRDGEATALGFGARICDPQHSAVGAAGL
jgi:hypothetical protein